MQIEKDVHRLLISTTSRLVGVHESNDLRINHAWPGIDSGHRIFQGLDAGAHSRNYFVVSVRVVEGEEVRHELTDYTFLGDQFCIALSILYGKRFDNHGLLVSHGRFFVPDTSVSPITYFNAPPHSHKPRRDLGLPLNLSHFAAIAPLFDDGAEVGKFHDILFAAGKFYLRSLQMFDREPELAYLDLVTCGEILSNYYDYDSWSLLDKGTKACLDRVRRELKDGESVVRQLSRRIRQVKRAYMVTLLDLLTREFFTATESLEEFAKLEEKDIERRLSASYDLRSLYVHEGVEFGSWIRPCGILSEVSLNNPVLSNKALAKAVTVAPTFLGLERIVRYCLLRFIHLKGCFIDSALDGHSLSRSK